MGRSFNTVGGGAKTNLNGLAFERENDLRDFLKKDANLTIESSYEYYLKYPEYLEKYRPSANSKQKKTLENILKLSYIVSDKKGIIGEVISQHNLYRYLQHNGVNFKDINSKKYVPDEAFINYRTNELYIIEKKYQNGGGSVAEKLETFVFKREKYEKLFMLDTSFNKNLLYKEINDDVVKDLVSKVNFIFVANDFFSHNSFDDVFEFMKMNDISYFVNEKMPLSVLGINYDN